MAAAELVDEVTEVIRELDGAAARWEGDRDRQAAAEAIDAADRAVALLHRVRDALALEVRRHDLQTRPHDPRD